MVAGPQDNSLPARVARLEQALANLSSKTLFSASVGAGGIAINNGGKITIGPGGSIKLPAGGTITDAVGDIIFSADSLSGQRLSTPFLSVGAAAKWDGADGFTFRSGGNVGDYAFQAAHCTSETTLWVGIIPQVIHPGIFYTASVGRMTGATSIPTYRLYLNGNLLDTHTVAAYGYYTCPFRSITSITSFGSNNFEFHLTVQADVTSTDYFACTFNGLTMCGN